MELSKTYKVFVDHERMINAEFLELQKDPELNFKQAELVVGAMIALAQKNQDKKFDILVNLDWLGFGTYVAKETRKLYINALKNSQINKFAVFGKSKVYKVVVNFMAVFIGKRVGVKWLVNRR